MSDIFSFRGRLSHRTLRARRALLRHVVGASTRWQPFNLFSLASRADPYAPPPRSVLDRRFAIWRDRLPFSGVRSYRYLTEMPRSHLSHGDRRRLQRVQSRVIRRR